MLYQEPIPGALPTLTSLSEQLYLALSYLMCALCSFYYESFLISVMWYLVEYLEETQAYYNSTVFFF